MAAETTQKESDRLKALGNELFVAKQYHQALALYTQAINVDPTNAVLYSNRATTNFLLEHYAASVEDSAIAIQHDPKNAKAWYRRAESYTALGKLFEAQKDYKQVCFKKKIPHFLLVQV